MIVIADEVLEKAKKYLVEKAKEWIHGICWGACLSLEGKDISESMHTACHSWLTYKYNRIYGKPMYNMDWQTSYLPDAKPFLCLSCHRFKKIRTTCSREASDAIILWMARESPFSSYILNRDDTESLLEGGVILLCGPGGLQQAHAMWVCKVLRYATEGSQALDVWLSLTKAGVNPLLALYVSSSYRTVNGAKFGYTGDHAHSTVFCNGADIPSLLKGTVNEFAVDTSSVFSESTTSPILIDLQDLARPVKVSDGWGGTVKASDASESDFVKKVLELQNKFSASLPSKNTVYLDLDM